MKWQLKESEYLKKLRFRQIEIKLAFTQEVNTCKYCLKLLENEDQDNPRIDIIWTENKKYRVFTNFHRSFFN